MLPDERPPGNSELGGDPFLRGRGNLEIAEGDPEVGADDGKTDRIELRPGPSIDQFIRY